MSYIKTIYFDVTPCCKDFIQGIEFLEQCAVSDSINCFKKACDSVATSDRLFPKYKSYYGLSCLLNGDDSGMEICRNLVSKCPYDADVCLNLARAEAFAANRREALYVVNKGLYFSAQHDGLNAFRQKLGIRGRKFVPFLPRNNRLNIALGKLFRRK